jgi:hypothetical protein
MNYIVVLFKNKERKKIIKKFVTFERAKVYYENLLNQSENIIFDKKVEENVVCNFELGLVDLNPTSFNSLYIRDDYGRQIKVETDSENYKIIKVSKYKIEELIYDVSQSKRIDFNKFLKSYVLSKTFKLISKINNKVVVQDDNQVNLFTFKTVDESHRFLSILESYLIDNNIKNCVIVFDTSKSQKKYLYDTLNKLGVGKRILYRKYTSFPTKK